MRSREAAGHLHPPAAPLAIPPAAPRPPTPPPVRPPAAPVSPRPAPTAAALPPAPVLPSGPSSEAMTSGPPQAEFAMGGILNAAPMAAPNLEPVFPGEEGIPSRRPALSRAAGICHPLRRQRRRRRLPKPQRRRRLPMQWIRRLNGRPERSMRHRQAICSQVKPHAACQHRMHRMRRPLVHSVAMRPRMSWRKRSRLLCRAVPRRFPGSWRMLAIPKAAHGAGSSQHPF